MADTKVSALTSATPIGTDEIYLIDDPSGTPLSKRATVQSLLDAGTINNGNWSGTDLSVANGGTGASTLAAADIAELTNLASTANLKGAALIGIEDSGVLITATTVEGALAENRTAIDAIEAAGYITATLTDEEVQDKVGAMLVGTETGITVTYQDATADIDFVVGGLSTTQFTSANISQWTNDSAYLTAITGLAPDTATTEAAQPNITSLGTLTTLAVDNITVNGNTISSTAGVDLNITPLEGQQLVLDGTIVVDAGEVTGASSITSTTFVGALTGEADTVTTNANLTGHITSSGSNATALGSFTVSDLSTAISDATLSGNNTGDEAVASLTVSGTVELATIAETDTGTDATRAVTPDGLNGALGSTVQAYDVDTLKADVADILTAGFAHTPFSAGTKSSGTYTPVETSGNMQYAVNGGAHTLAPMANNGTVIIQYTNNASAGAITTSGFTIVNGDALTTVNGDDFMINLVVNNAFSVMTVTALQ